jgi:Helix-turn-helix domain of resolvase
MESARQLLAGGMPPRDVARNLAVSVPTLYRWLPSRKVKVVFDFVGIQSTMDLAVRVLGYDSHLAVAA